MWVLVNRLCKRQRQESHAPPLPPFQCFEASDFCKWNTRATRTRPSKFFELEQPQNRNARKTLNGGEGGRGFLKFCCLYKMGFGFVPLQIDTGGAVKSCADWKFWTGVVPAAAAWRCRGTATLPRRCRERCRVASTPLKPTVPRCRGNLLKRKYILLLLLLKLRTEGCLGTEAFALELVRFRSPGRVALRARCHLSGLIISQSPDTRMGGSDQPPRVTPSVADKSGLVGSKLYPQIMQSPFYCAAPRAGKTTNYFNFITI